jgi:acyl carrier protein
MRPSAYFVLPEIPLTAHGKVDRDALRQTLEPKPDSNGKSRASVTRTEQAILDIWEEVLQRKDIGTDDDFFDLGGTSLALIRIFGQVNRTFDVSLDPGVLSEEGTIARLARSVDAELQNGRVHTPEKM